MRPRPPVHSPAELEPPVTDDRHLQFRTPGQRRYGQEGGQHADPAEAFRSLVLAGEGDRVDRSFAHGDPRSRDQRRAESRVW